MADTPVTYALRGAALATIFENKIAPQINRASVTLQLLNKIPADGKNVSWVAKVGTAVPTTAAIADGVDVTNYNADSKLAATLEFAHYHDAFAVTGFAQAAARIAGNPAQLANLLDDEANDSTDRLGAAIGTHIFTGTGANDQMLGLIDGTAGGLLDSGTYAGIDRANYTQFKGNVVDAKNAPISSAAIRQLLRAIYTNSGKRADALVTTPIIFDQLAESLKAQRRFVQDVSLGRGQIKLDGGFTMLDFDGIPVFADVRLSAGYFCALNTTEHRIRYMPSPTSADYMNAYVTATPEAQLKMSGTGLMGRVIKLARTGDKDKFGVFVDLQVQSRTPNAGGFIKNILEV